ncbi:MAG: hypothetical protein Phog2KO_03420 [Phototrophicaceae bacterium]
MDDIFFIVFGLSVPIFYLWGGFAFFQKFFGGKKEPKVDASANKMLEYLFKRAEENPDLSLQDFLDEVQQSNKTSVSDSEQHIDFDDIAISDETEQPQRLGDLVSAPQNANLQPARFSWREWYADHSIDFILYLGAFMIVSAVTLFVGFQWDNFGGVTRFAIVLGFTIAWYVAGVGVQGLLSLDNVGIVFITIGAILTPFCGLAWQEFVVGSLDEVGITWLITSILGTIIYMTLSLIYQRRHFTYFGNLSILASMLSLVEISGSEQEYFILSANLTALILLIGRIAIKQLAPRLEAYLGVDFERSSFAIAVFSVIAGALLIPATSLPISSIQVLAVMISTLVYACLYTWLNTNAYTVTITQMLAIMTLANALLTFNVDAKFVLYIVLVAHVALQVAINQWLENNQPEALLPSNTFALIVSGFIYLISIILFEGGLLAVPILLTLIGHSAFYATRLDKPHMWYLTAILFYPLLAHLLYILDIADVYWVSAYIALSAIQVLLVFTTLDTSISRAFLHVGLFVAFWAGFASTGMLLSGVANNALEIVLLRLNPFVTIMLIGVALVKEKSQQIRLLPSYTPIALASVPILYYISVIATDEHLMIIGFALSVSVLFWLAHELTGNPRLHFITFAAPYIVLLHIADMLNLPLEIYPIVVSVLSVLLYFTKFFPEDTLIPRKIVALLALVLVSIGAFLMGLSEETMLFHFMGWVSAYICLALIWVSEDFLGKRLHDLVFVIAVLAQYYWHIIFLQVHVNSEIFENIQWYTAPLGTVLFAFSLINFHDDENSAFGVQFLGAIFLMLPTFSQIIYDSSLLYFGLGIGYSLIFGAIAISFKQVRLRTLSAVSLVLVVLLQNRDFFTNLPRWLVFGAIGFGLLGAGLYLSIRRRNVER